MRIALCLGIVVGMFTACEMPEQAPTFACVVTNPNSITINYACQDGTYRCTNADGSTKYKDCMLEDVYCVESCR